MQELIN